MADALGGRTILVTRPQHQADEFARCILAAGGTPLKFPSMVIEPARAASELDAALLRLDQHDLVIFVSANAVFETRARLAAGGGASLRDIAIAAAPGPGTAAALREAGVKRVLAPIERFDSEGLLAQIDLEGLTPSRVLLLRGEGNGRDWLADALRGRGAAVDVVACYRRRRATPDARALRALLDGPVPDAITITSAEGGAYLLDMLGGSAIAWINRAPVFVPHANIAARLGALGVRGVRVTAGGDAGLVRGLIDHFKCLPFKCLPFKCPPS